MAHADIVMPLGHVEMDDMARAVVPVELEGTPRAIYVDVPATSGHASRVPSEGLPATEVPHVVAQPDQNDPPVQDLLHSIVPPVPGMLPNPTDPNAPVTNPTFDAMTVLSMHYHLNEKVFRQLQEGTEVIQISDEDSTHRGLECTICLDDIESGQMVTRVPCEGNHTFHHDCLNRWMATKLFNEQPAFCPNCNFKILEPLRTRETPTASASARRRPVAPMSWKKFIVMCAPLVIIVVLFAVLFPRTFGKWCPRGCKSEANSSGSGSADKEPNRSRCGDCRQAPLRHLFSPLRADQARRELQLRLPDMARGNMSK